MSINLPLISVNGVLDAAISPLDRGFAYGDGVFETCRYSQGAIPLWSYHRERLSRSAERLKIPLNESLLAQYLDAMLAHLRDANIAHALSVWFVRADDARRTEGGELAVGRGLTRGAEPMVPPPNTRNSIR